MGDVQYQVMNSGEVRNVLLVASDIAYKFNRNDYDSFCSTFCVGLPLLLLQREHTAQDWWRKAFKGYCIVPAQTLLA